MVSNEQIQAFFFKAMIEGWAKGGEKIKIPDMPGYKAIPFRDGHFYLLDRYCVAPDSLCSAGTTTIWYLDIPVWVMNYGGQYEKCASEVVKHALLKNYRAQEFFGGRGPQIYSEGDLVYLNRVEHNDFSRFQGREQVFSCEECGGKQLGFHDYSGMSLL